MRTKESVEVEYCSSIDGVGILAIVLHDRVLVIEKTENEAWLYPNGYDWVCMRVEATVKGSTLWSSSTPTPCLHLSAGKSSTKDRHVAAKPPAGDEQ